MESYGDIGSYGDPTEMRSAPMETHLKSYRNPKVALRKSCGIIRKSYGTPLESLMNLIESRGHMVSYRNPMEMLWNHMEILMEILWNLVDMLCNRLEIPTSCGDPVESYKNPMK